ncbi:MAG: HAD family phosphatase [Bacteroidales bacterium]|jgi:putative hydrolase of the HAD superfamily|nr:HAD family phosphatase [Bacteroidales bacterium]MEE0992677.1 HAD family phosphatase [Bacteroidales bacterium]
MIKNLLLDMGGVILDVSYQRVIETFKSYGIENFDKVYTQAKQVEIIDLFEEGKCTAEEFRDGVRKLVGKELSDEQIDKAWFSMILEIPRDVIQLLGVLKLKYRLFLFSNTNVLHIEYLKKEFERQLGFDLFNCVFDKAFFSNEIHHRKPHPESFKYVLEQAGIEAEETLFIDDSKQHLEGASKVGLNTYWLTNGETLIDLYDKKII